MHSSPEFFKKYQKQGINIEVKFSLSVVIVRLDDNFETLLESVKTLAKKVCSLLYCYASNFQIQLIASFQKRIASYQTENQRLRQQIETLIWEKQMMEWDMQVCGGCV